MDVLKPILMGSPHSIAKSIPFEPDVFDLVIFDEASQIPLPHALGSIARAKKVAVAGDEQQMAPSFYFKKGVNSSRGSFTSSELLLEKLFFKTSLSIGSS